MINIHDHESNANRYQTPGQMATRCLHVAGEGDARMARSSALFATVLRISCQQTEEAGARQSSIASSQYPPFSGTNTALPLRNTPAK